MSSRPSRRPTIVDRLKKLFKPTRPATVPTQLPEAVESQRAPTSPKSRLYPLGNRSEGNIAHKWSLSTKTNNKSSVSLGQLPTPAKGAKWYIPNETTLFPLPAPGHSALRSQPVSPITPSQGRARYPSLSTSVSSHGTSDLHTPNSTLESRPPQQLHLWIPEPKPKPGIITTPGFDDPGFPTAAAYRDRDGDRNGDGDGEGDGIYLNPYNDRDGNDGEGDSDRGDREAREGPDSAPATKLGNLGLRKLELRSSVWIRNEVESIHDEEMKRLASLAFL